MWLFNFLKKRKEKKKHLEPVYGCSYSRRITCGTETNFLLLLDGVFFIYLWKMHLVKMWYVSSGAMIHHMIYYCDYQEYKMVSAYLLFGKFTLVV